MSKIDSKIVDNLDIFTKTLGDLVELMKEQIKEGQSDVVNKIGAESKTEEIKMIIEGIKEIKDDTKIIKSKQDEILKEVRDARKSSESGVFGEIKEDKNVKAIKDGIKIVFLIAGAVLAVGMAFKIIGKVDPLSVLSISFAIVAISYAFEKISSLKCIDGKTIFSLTGSLVLMSIAIVASSYILSTMSTITFAQGLTAIFVAVAIGGALLGLSYSISKMKPGDIAALIIVSPFLPLLFTSIGWAISKASVGISNVVPISFAQGMSLILLSVSLGLATVAIAKSASMLKDTKYDRILMATSIIPLVAGSLVLASFILKGLQPLGLTQMLSLFVITLGLTIGLMGIGAFLFLMNGFNMEIAGKSVSVGKIKPSDVLMAIGVIPAISYGLVLSSQILQGFEPLKQPWEFTKSTLAMGIGLLAFTPSVIFLGKQKIKDIFSGALMIPVVATSMMLSSWILSVGNYKNYPPLDWTIGTSAALLAFGIGTISMGFLMASTGGLGFGALALGAAAIVLVATSIMATERILSLGKFDKYPSTDWIVGVSKTMLTFAGLSVLLAATSLVSGVLSLFTGGDPLVNMAKRIKSVSDILGSVQTTTNFTWIGDLSKGLNSFVDVIKNMDSVPILDTLKMNMITNQLEKLNDVGQKTDGIMKLSFSLQTLASSLNSIRTDGIEKLLKMSSSFFALSFVNKDNLDSTLSLLKDRANDVSQILDQSFKFTQTTTPSPTPEIKTPSEEIKPMDMTQQKQNVELETLNVLKNMDGNIKKLLSQFEKLDKAKRIG